RWTVERSAREARTRRHVGVFTETGRLVGRSANGARADVAQLAERVLGKDEVTSSILVIGSSLRSPATRASFGSASQLSDEGLSRRSARARRRTTTAVGHEQKRGRRHG